jgi:hypothetical protein
MPFGLAVSEGVGYQGSHPSILEPHRPESSFVGFAVEGQEGAARGCGRGERWERTATRRDRARETPGEEEEVGLVEIRMIMRELSSVVHARLTDESVCPTIQCAEDRRYRRKM